MLKLKTLSGSDLIKIFTEFDFNIVSQKGSHIKVQRILDNKIKQSLTIPNHKELDKGTIKAIYRQSIRYISETELKDYFYNS